MSAGLILTIGTTADPLIKALEEGVNENIRFVYILYGRAFPNQSPNPFDMANEVKNKASSLNLESQTFEVGDPEDFDSCLLTVLEAIKRINENKLDKLIVNFTGGTKPMSAGLIHAILTEPLDPEIILDYTGGIVRNEAGRVISGAMRVKRHHETRAEKIARDALNLLKSCHYSQAYSITRGFPDSGKFGFLKKVFEILYLWDNFLYKESFEILKKIRPSVDFLSGEAQLEDILRIVNKIMKPSYSITKATGAFLRIQNGEDIAKTIKGIELQEQYLIPADCLENAQRRHITGSYTDVVLRAYRAIESAIQIELILSGINPWDFKIEQINGQRKEKLLILTGKDIPPSQVALFNGLRILQAFDKDIPENLKDPLKEIQNVRNSSYLEHGYQRVDKNHAHRILENAVEIVGNILETNIKETMEKIRIDLT